MKWQCLGWFALVGALLILPQSQASAGDELVIYENGLGYGRSPTDQAQSARKFGFKGVSLGGGSLDGIEERLAAFGKEEIEVRALYVGCKVGPNGGSFDTRLPRGMQLYKGQKVDVWLYFQGRGVAREVGDAQVVKILQEVGDLAAKSGLRVSIYPHFGFYVERFDHAVELVKKADRENVGVCFNLCHFLRTEPVDNLSSQLKAGLPQVSWVNINGTDREGTAWSQLIQPLDEGDFDLLPMLQNLRKWNYQGGYAQQCYGVKVGSEENLRRSMKKWNELQKQLED